jgi:uncharacterized protein with HEPN domain
MLDVVEQILSYTTQVADAEEFFQQRLVFDATLMNIVVLGEMSARVSETLRSDHPDEQWQEIKSFRNLVAHEYLGIDAEEVWQIVQDDIPEPKAALQRVVETLPTPE